MTEFKGVVPALEQALIKRGYAELTPVQKAVLAPELQEADALVSAQTGSGKTVAFGLTLAHALLDGKDRFDQAKAPLALIVAPTRELALQVTRELEWLYEMTGASVVSCVGGMDGRTERRNLERGAHIVVGTPGRLCDHIDRRAFNTSNLKAVVLDEADEMLDLGFREDLEFILDAAPTDRRTLMFSATVPRSIATLAKRYQRDAVRVVTSEEHKQHLDIDYRALATAPKDQENAIINVLRYFDAKNALVFCGTRAMVNHMTARFNNRGFSVVALSGELSQAERSHALQAMRDGRAKVCIATDVAARGIDLPNLELVIHADLPKNKESLLHRSGRTGRAGRKGVSALIVPHKARKRTERLLRDAGIEATWATPPSADDILKRDDERILADPALSEPLQEDEQAFASELVARHGAEQIAAAFIRQCRAGQSAPEELQDTPLPERTTKQTNNFTDGVWISLSVGRNQKAEPGWLLAMLCRVGNLSKPDVGAIRIDHTQTYVELEPGAAERFFKATGDGTAVEKNVTVTRLDRAPEAFPDTRPDSRDRSFGKKKKFGAGKSGARDGARDGARGGARDGARGGARGRIAKKRPFDDKPSQSAGDDKPWAKNKKSRDDKPRDKTSQSAGDDKPWAKNKKSRDDKPRDKTRIASTGKKPFKSKEAAPFTKSGGKGDGEKSGAKSGANKSGFTPLKRKKPNK